MTTPRTCCRLAALALLVALALAGASAAAATEIVFNESCFPTCDTRDGRLLIMAGGPGLETRSDTPMNLKFHIESSAVAVDPTFTIDIFDGDTLKCSTAGACDPIYGVGEAHWDVGKPVPLFFTLYAVAEQLDGSSVMTLVDPADIELDGGAVAASNPFSGDDMFDDAWFRIRVTVGSEAEAVGSGDYRYQLKMELDPSAVYAANEGTLNALKVRTSASLLLSRVEQPFAFEAKWTNLYDLQMVYPNFDLTDPFNPTNAEGSTYDGTFTFFFYVPPDDPGNPRTELSIFDADLDHGNYDGSVVDRDDPDTSGDLGDLPFPVGSEVHLEGESGAAPFDDKAPTGLGLYLARSPAVTYRLIFPPNTDPGAIVCRAGDSMPGPPFNGRPSIFNLNPSGNREWEAFTLSTAVFDGSAMDCHVDSIPAGTYRVDLIGMDMNNLNAWYFAGDVCGQRPDGKSSCIPGTLKLGDTVWADNDGDGNGDPAEIAADGEVGIAAVTMILEDAASTELARTLTDVNGTYNFDVAPGEYTVRVAPENFTGPTAGGAVGNRVWLDKDGNGNQDTNEPGLNGIEVLLFDAGGDNAVGGGDDRLVTTTRTAGDGNYRFGDLPPASYYTEIAEGSSPAGLTLSGGTDPSAVRTITATETFLDLDFGFTHDDVDTAIIGDFVWHDLNNNGSRASREPGIDGVVVTLLDGSGSVVAKTTTSGGYYLFTGVAPGTYQVDVTDEAGVLAGYTLTTFNDPTPQFLVAAGDAILDKDFGYDNNSLYRITDRLWVDADRDGVFDSGEAVIGGVTVALVGADGAVLATTTTSSTNGRFRFPGLPNGAYSTVITDLNGVLDGLLPTTQPALTGSGAVRIDGAHVTGNRFGYVSGGALVDLLATTTSPAQTNTVTNQNVLTYDFGYLPPDGGYCLDPIDFETDAAGNPVVLGQIIDDEWAAWGVQITTNDPGNHPAMIFDSANPTGGDVDLGAPNEDFGGPGEGAGGGAGQPGENALPLGQVLIISEDGDQSDPDDNAGGGMIRFTFDFPVHVDEMTFLDIDLEAGANLAAYDADDNLIAEAFVPEDLGDNAVWTLDLDVDGVRRLDVVFPASGAITDLTFCVPGS